MSESGFSRLLERASADTDLHVILRGRADMPPRHLARLVEIAREQVRESLREELFEAVDAAVATALEDAAKEAAAKAEPQGSPRALAAAAAAVARKAESDGITEDDVAALIKAGRIDEALAAIALLADAPIETVARAYGAIHHDPLLFIVRSVRFGWATFKLLLNARSGRQLPAEELKNAFEGYQHLSVQTAQRVVRFTAARERASQGEAA
jgi:hypothetical protein